MSRRQSTLALKRSKPWAPRAAIAPKCRRKGDAFVVVTNGSAGCYGGWDLTYAAPKAGTWVRFCVKARWCDLQRGYDSAEVDVMWLDAKGAMVGWEPIFPTDVKAGHVVYEGRVRVSQGATAMVARLFMAWSATGQIEWTDPQVTRAPAPKPRKMRLGAAGGALPPGKRTVRSNTEFYLGLCREALAKQVDLLCLPEIMLSCGQPVDNHRLAKMAAPVPGEHTEPFQDFARENRMALCYSVLEKNDEMVHNTAVLIGKDGRLVGTYRKVHLASPLEVWWGVTPGHDFPVYNLHGVKVGMNICMDSSAAESSRVPARLGAEIICLPIMGDHRASTCITGSRQHEFDINRWQMIQSVHAMDNHVYMLVSRNAGIGCGIFSPRGEVLALSAGGRLVTADVDLEDLPRTGHDSTFRGVCWHERREPAYGPLAGDLSPDPFA